MQDDVETQTAATAAELGGKKVATKKVVKKKAGAKAKAAPSKKSEAKTDEGYVSLADLAEEADLSPSSARVRLRNAEVPNETGRYKFKEGSSALKAARKALGL